MSVIDFISVRDQLGPGQSESAPAATDKAHGANQPITLSARSPNITSIKSLMNCCFGR